MGVLVRTPGDSVTRPVREDEPLEPGTRVVARMSRRAQVNRHGKPAGLNLVARTASGRTEIHKPRSVATVRPFFQVETHAVGPIVARTGMDPLEVSATFTTTTGERVALSLDFSRKLKGKAPRLGGAKVTLEAVDPDEFGYASSWVARGLVPADGPRGRHGATVRVKSDVVRQGCRPGQTYGTQAQLNCWLTGPVTLDATYISCGLMRPGAPRATRQRRVTLTSHDLDLGLGDLHATVVPDQEKGQAPAWIEDIALELLRGEVPDQFILQLELPPLPASSDGAFRARIRIDVDRKGEPPLWARLSGVVRKEFEFAGR